MSQVFNPTDLFVLQRTDANSGPGTYKVSMQVLEEHFAQSPAIFFRGGVNLTVGPTSPLMQLDPNPPNNGDLYINSTAGQIADGWTGIAGQSCTVGDRIVWDTNEETELEPRWVLIRDVSAGGIVQEIASTLPIRVADTEEEMAGASPTRPVVYIDDATGNAPGVAVRAQDSDFTANSNAGRGERDGHPIFATPEDVRKFAAQVDDGAPDPNADGRYLRKDSGAGAQTVESTGLIDFKGTANFDGGTIKLKSGGAAEFASGDIALNSNGSIFGKGNVIIDKPANNQAFIARLQGVDKAWINSDGSAEFKGTVKQTDGAWTLNANGSATFVGTIIGQNNLIIKPLNAGGGIFVRDGVSSADNIRLLSDGSAEFSGGNTRIETGDENQNEHGLIHYEHPDLPDNDYKIETEAPDTMLPSKGYIKKALNNVKLAFKFVGTYDMRNAPPTDVLVGNVYVHLRDIPENGSDPYEENVGDTMHPDWVKAWNTEGLADGATHPLPRTMEKAFFGDFVGAGVNWWAKIGKVDDIGPEDLLQNLESVLTRGNDSTKGLTLGCDEPAEGENPDPTTAKIVLANEGYATFAGDIQISAGTNGFNFYAGSGTMVITNKNTTGAQADAFRIYDGTNTNGVLNYPVIIKTDGSAEFAGGNIQLYSNGSVDAFRAGNRAQDPIFNALSGASFDSRTSVASINADGSAEFKGPVEIGNPSFDQTTPGVLIDINENTKSASVLAFNQTTDENFNMCFGAYGPGTNNQVASIKNDGSAAFAGEVKIAVANNWNSALWIGSSSNAADPGVYADGGGTLECVNLNVRNKGADPNINLSSDGSAEFKGKVTAASTQSTDPGNTLVTKDYLEGTGDNGYLLKDFSSYPSITEATFTVPEEGTTNDLEVEINEDSTDTNPPQSTY